MKIDIDKLKFKAKIQAIGKNTNGSPRYMIYITKAVKLFNLAKGDTVEYSLEKIGKDIPQNVIDISRDENEVIPSSADITEEELLFKTKYVKMKELDPNRAVAIKLQAIEQFGKDRVQIILGSIE